MEFNHFDFFVTYFLIVVMLLFQHVNKKNLCQWPYVLHLFIYYLKQFIFDTDVRTRGICR